MRLKDEDGQALILVALAMSIFLIGAIGLAVDGSNLYTQRQFAQAAADAAAQAAMMSVFDGTNTVTGNAADFSTGSTFTCGSTTNASTPCVFASDNGFGSASGDTVTVSFPADSTVPGVSFSSDTVHLIQVSVSRNVNTTLMRLLGSNVTTVTATADAAIVTVTAPTPIIVTDPTNSGTLSMNGTTSIQICGGPSRSIQVNSSNSQAFTGGGTIDLSHAGPLDPGNSTTGTGADFGVFGGNSTNPGSVQLGTLPGKYLSPASPILDPLAFVTAPTAPAAAPAAKAIHSPTDGCTSSCIEYSPGLYSGGNGLTPGNNTVIFKPGLYYVSDGGGGNLN